MTGSSDKEMTMTAIQGATSTAFFVFDGEAISVQMSLPPAVPVKPRQKPDAAARLAAAQALLRAAALLVRGA